MATSNPSDTFIASGDIRPCRFVKGNASADFGCTEADANEALLGISGKDQKSFDGTLHAAANDQAHVFLDGAMCQLEIGSGGVTAQGFLKSDADGKGVAVATTGTTEQNIGARALETGVEGDLIRVQVMIRSRYPELS